ncbi:MAG: phosphotransferase [Chloroflexi bacterium]|nr:phosphotransferase [Chloroflexota bacterium]
MRNDLFATVEAMLEPAALSALTGQPVTAVRHRPFHSADSLSGSRFLAIETDGPTPDRYIVKRINRAWDWIMRTTDDRQGRAIAAWQAGLIAGLPPEITTGYVACARDGDGWAILLRDLGAALVPPGDAPITADDNAFFLDAMAAMHATFWQQPHRADPALGFCALIDHYRELAPAVVAREANGDDPIPPLIGAGWALLPDLMAPAVVAVVQPLLADPTPLATALARGPQTIVHGDWKLGNLGLLAGPPRQVVLLDWAVVGPAPAVVDLAWYLAVNSARLPVTKEVAIACYRAALARRLGAAFDDAWWAPQLDLALLGGFLQLGWPKLLGVANGATAALRTREQVELDWWSERVLAGARRLALATV